MSKMEDVDTGTQLAGWIGEVVTLDIEGEVFVGTRGGMLGTRKNRTLIFGVLTYAEDSFGRGHDLTDTYLEIGGVYIILDWSKVLGVKVQGP